MTAPVTHATQNWVNQAIQTAVAAGGGTGGSSTTPGPAGKDGVNGKDGLPGATGPAGPPLDIQGELPDPADLPVADQTPGDAYLIDTHLWVYTAENGWLDLGALQGVPGSAGKDGAAGTAGKDGAAGAAGRGISSASISNGHLVLTYSDATTADLGQVVGPKGDKGDAGTAGTGGTGSGTAGRGVSTVAVNASNHLIITYTDNTTADAGVITVTGGTGGTGTNPVRGLYSGAATYASGDVVAYNGALYQAKQAVAAASASLFDNPLTANITGLTVVGPGDFPPISDANGTYSQYTGYNNNQNALVFSPANVASLAGLVWKITEVRGNSFDFLADFYVGAGGLQTYGANFRPSGGGTTYRLTVMAQAWTLYSVADGGQYTTVTSGSLATVVQGKTYVLTVSTDASNQVTFSIAIAGGADTVLTTQPAPSLGTAGVAFAFDSNASTSTRFRDMSVKPLTTGENFPVASFVQLTLAGSATAGSSTAVKGVWDSALTYAKNDVVGYRDTMWQAKTAVSSTAGGFSNSLRANTTGLTLLGYSAPVPLTGATGTALQEERRHQALQYSQPGGLKSTVYQITVTRPVSGSSTMLTFGQALAGDAYQDFAVNANYFRENQNYWFLRLTQDGVYLYHQNRKQQDGGQSTLGNPWTSGPGTGAATFRIATDAAGTTRITMTIDGTVKELINAKFVTDDEILTNNGGNTGFGFLSDITTDLFSDMTVASTSSIPTFPVNAFTRLFAPATTVKGRWANDASYVTGDVVGYGPSMWQAKNDVAPGGAQVDIFPLTTDSTGMTLVGDTNLPLLYDPTLGATFQLVDNSQMLQRAFAGTLANTSASMTFTRSASTNNGALFTFGSEVSGAGSSWLSSAPLFYFVPFSSNWAIFARSGATETAKASGRPYGAFGESILNKTITFTISHSADLKTKITASDGGTTVTLWDDYLGIPPSPNGRSAYGFDTLSTSDHVKNFTVTTPGVGTFPAASFLQLDPPAILYPQRATATKAVTVTAGAKVGSTLPLATGYRLLRLSTDKPARVRLYTSALQRDDDRGRAIGTDPTGNHGLVTDVVTSATNLTYDLTPQVHGANLDATPTADIPMNVDNLATTDGVTVTAIWIRTE